MTPPTGGGAKRKTPSKTRGLNIWIPAPSTLLRTSLAGTILNRFLGYARNDGCVNSVLRLPGSDNFLLCIESMVGQSRHPTAALRAKGIRGFVIRELVD